jgi:endonuclease YncB( thermonuclease family)
MFGFLGEAARRGPAAGVCALIALASGALPAAAAGVGEPSLVALVSLPLDLVGAANVIDGDTIELNGTRVELYGIDAPEIAQTCTIMVFSWESGVEASKMLRALVAGRAVSCLGRARAADSSITAVCRTAGVDLNETMVRIGMALASRGQSSDYVGDETVARAEEMGVWLSRFDPPWEWGAEND